MYEGAIKETLWEEPQLTCIRWSNDCNPASEPGVVARSTPAWDPGGSEVDDGYAGYCPSTHTYYRYSNCEYEIAREVSESEYDGYDESDEERYMYCHDPEIVEMAEVMQVMEHNGQRRTTRATAQ